MKKPTIYIMILVFALLISCSSDRPRIELMEKELGLNLPDTYEQITNTTDGNIDFEINIELKFQKTEMDQIMGQIKKSKYFVQIEQQGLDSTLLQNIKADTTINGIWRRTDQGFNFVKSRNEKEPVNAIFDTINQTLKFNFIHI
jgi:hypothetical protein